MKKFVVAVDDKYMRGGGCRIQLVDNIENARFYSARHHAARSIAQAKQYCWSVGSLDAAKVIEVEFQQIVEKID